MQHCALPSMNIPQTYLGDALSLTARLKLNRSYHISATAQDYLRGLYYRHEGDQGSSLIRFNFVAFSIQREKLAAEKVRSPLLRPVGMAWNAAWSSLFVGAERSAQTELDITNSRSAQRTTTQCLRRVSCNMPAQYIDAEDALLEVFHRTTEFW